MNYFSQRYFLNLICTLTILPCLYGMDLSSLGPGTTAAMTTQATNILFDTLKLPGLCPCTREYEKASCPCRTVTPLERNVITLVGVAACACCGASGYLGSALTNESPLLAKVCCHICSACGAAHCSCLAGMHSVTLCDNLRRAPNPAICMDLCTLAPALPKKDRFPGLDL